MEKIYKYPDIHTLVSGPTKRTNTFGFCNAIVVSVTAELKRVLLCSFITRRITRIKITNLPTTCDLQIVGITDEGLQRYFYREIYPAIKSILIERLDINELDIAIDFNTGVAIASLPVSLSHVNVIQFYNQIRLHH